jgi:hypothetical protein
MTIQAPQFIARPAPFPSARAQLLQRHSYRAGAATVVRRAAAISPLLLAAIRQASTTAASAAAPIGD